jgi:hypothetical protein
MFFMLDSHASLEPDLVENGYRLDASDNTTTVEDTFRGGIVIYRTQDTTNHTFSNFLHRVNQQLDLIDTTATGHRMLNNLAFGNATSAQGHTVRIFNGNNFNHGGLIPLLDNSAILAAAQPAWTDIRSQRESVAPNAQARNGTDSILVLGRGRSFVSTADIAHELSHAHAFQRGISVPNTDSHPYPGMEYVSVGYMLEEMENIGLAYNRHRGGISENAIIAELRSATGSWWRYRPRLTYNFISSRSFLKNFKSGWPEGYAEWLAATTSDDVDHSFIPYRHPDRDPDPPGIGSM